MSAWTELDFEAVHACPVCGSTRRRTFHRGLRDQVTGAVPGHCDLQECEDCGAAYADPRPTRLSIGKAYEGYFTHEPADQLDSATLGFKAWVRRVVANGYINHLMGCELRPASAMLGRAVAALLPWRGAEVAARTRSLPRLAPQSGRRRLLDVGCGNGAFLALAARAGWAPFGVELDPDAARQAAVAGISMLGSEVSEVASEHDGSFDRIMLSHVIEHVYDPVEVLRHCKRLLAPEGRLWMETPNFDAYGHELYGRHWRGLEPPRHLVLFRHRALEAALRAAGFQHMECLPAHPAWRVTLADSQIIEAGEVVFVQGRKNQRVFEDLDTVRLNRESRQAQQVVTHDPRRSEFLTVLAW